MSFKDIENIIQSTYKSSQDDLVNDFYNIILAESIHYDRITGYFNSTSLAIAARGLVKFIDNDGHMRLLCGSELSEDDLNAILNADDLKDLINKKFLSDISNIENKIIENHVKILGWMVSNNLIEIKIGIKKNNTSYFGGMLHSKIGILKDNENNIISFDGSVNETANGWVNNIESLKVFKSWEDEKFMENDIDDFESYWNNLDPSLEVFDIPEASQKKLIDIAPKNKRELNKLFAMIKKSNKTKKLFVHQQNAIDSWFKNNKTGIFEMATGTGKTFTALKCLEKVLEIENVLTVIACPYTHIAEQWHNEVKEMNLARIYDFYSSVNPNWKTEFDKLKIQIKLQLEFKNVIITTHNTFCKKDFIDRIKECNIKTFLIVDEMHHVGAENFQLGLLDTYNYRLGLSATPARFMDYEGTDYIINYFDKITYKFTLIEALNKINPATNKTFLTPYNYYPIKVDLTKEELKKYIKLTKKIASFYYQNNEDLSENIKILIFKRNNIINNAIFKYDLLKKVLKQLNHKEHTIIYCSPQQIDKVQNILKEENFSVHKFTQKEDSKRSKKYGGISQRESILNSFDKGNYQVLLAIKCLDEGVDVPSADQVIIMSSTTNPVEYIQRRGRVLRRYPNKEKAFIYDFCVIPDYIDYYSKKIIDRESDRLIDFVNSSSNNDDCYKLLEKWGVY